MPPGAALQVDFILFDVLPAPFNFAMKHLKCTQKKRN
jgi:hypothetical protein